MAVQEETKTNQGGSTVEQAREQVEETAGQAREKAASALTQQADQRSTQAGEQVRSFGQALRRTGEQLRQEGNERPAQVAEQAASRLEGLGGYLERTDGEKLLRDVESFGRRQPWAIAGLGLVAGLAASRFMKASSERRYQSSMPQGAGSTGVVSSPPAAIPAQTGIGQGAGGM
jgi:hypothetical protein